MNIDDTLKERGTRYGKFAQHAEAAQRLKRVIAGYAQLVATRLETGETR